VKQIRYRDGYKYQLDEDYVHTLPFAVPTPIVHSLFRIVGTELIAHAAYAWDGASGGVDSDAFMRGSLVHDVLCQAMELRLLSYDYWDRAADELGRICREDGMWQARRWWVVRAVKLHEGAARHHRPKPIKVAPQSARRLPDVSALAGG
jgi:hypothetical protein